VRTAVGPFVQGASIPLAGIDPDTAAAALLPAAAAVPHLPRVTLDDTLLALAVRGGLLNLEERGADAVAAVDAAGQLVGILRSHPSGSHRLRPNFFGAG
jgi:hypothetical protein